MADTTAARGCKVVLVGLRGYGGVVDKCSWD
jgi:hypothetical protein